MKRQVQVFSSPALKNTPPRLKKKGTHPGAPVVLATHTPSASASVVERPTAKVIPYDFLFFLMLFVVSMGIAILVVTTVTDLYTPPVVEEPLPLQQVEPPSTPNLF